MVRQWAHQLNKTRRKVQTIIHKRLLVRDMGYSIANRRHSGNRTSTSTGTYCESINCNMLMMCRVLSMKNRIEIQHYHICTNLHKQMYSPIVVTRSCICIQGCNVNIDLIQQNHTFFCKTFHSTVQVLVYKDKLFWVRHKRHGN